MSIVRVLVALVFLSSLFGAMGNSGESVGQLEMVRTMRFLVNNADRFHTFMGLVDLYGLDPVQLGTAEHLTLLVPNDEAFKHVSSFVSSLTFEEKVKLLEFHALMDELDYSDRVASIPELDKVSHDGKRYVVERDVNTLAGIMSDYESGGSNSYVVSALMSNFTILARTGINKPRVLAPLRVVPHLKVYEVDQVLVPRALKEKFYEAWDKSSSPAPPPTPPPPISPDQNSAAAPTLFSWPWLVVAVAVPLLLLK